MIIYRLVLFVSFTMLEMASFPVRGQSELVKRTFKKEANNDEGQQSQ